MLLKRDTNSQLRCCSWRLCQLLSFSRRIQIVGLVSMIKDSMLCADFFYFSKSEDAVCLKTIFEIIAYLTKTLKIAKSIDNKKAVAITNNNLGVMSLESEDIKQSIAFFKRAYSAYQMSDYESGKMNSGINLLFSLVILGDKSTYDRIYNNASYNLSNGSIY